MERNALGQVTSGSGAINPGGMTLIEREARDAVRMALSAPGLRAKGLAAYEALLEEKNPLIVKDFLDRVAGKVKERVELADDEGNTPSWAKGATLAEILEIVRSGK